MQIKMVKASASECVELILSERSFSDIQSPEGARVCHGRPAGLHAHYVLLVSKEEREEENREGERK